MVEVPDLQRDDRGVLFSPDAEAISLGMAVDDPYPTLIALRDGPGVRKGALHELMGLPPQHTLHWEGCDAYTALSWSAVNQIFMDDKTFTNEVYKHHTEPLLGETLLSMDGPPHRRMRNVAKPFFKPTFVEGWWNDNWVAQTIDELFDRLIEKDNAELNMELCAILPVSVVSLGFGLERADILPFRKAIHDVIMHKDAESTARGGEQTVTILNRVIAERRKNPRDDLITKLIASQLELADGSSRRLTDDEILRYCRLIVFAGGGTTWRQLGTTIFALLNNPDQMAALRADRSLLRPTIQEVTRWYPTDPVFHRRVVQDTVLEGVEIKAGSVMHVCVAAANRDPDQWSNPDEFDIRRPVKRHFAFGAGQHACLGQHLSRQEMEAALNAVLDRLPGLRWDPAMPPARISGGTLLGRGPEMLHVRYDPARK